jgi:hypothetical protein
MSMPTVIATAGPAVESAKSVGPGKTGLKMEKNAHGVDAFMSLLAAAEPDTELTIQAIAQTAASDLNGGGVQNDIAPSSMSGAAVDLAFFLNQGKQWPVKEAEILTPTKSVDSPPTTAVIDQVTDRTQPSMARTGPALPTVTPPTGDDGKGKKIGTAARVSLQNDSGGLAALASLGLGGSGSALHLNQEILALKAEALSMVKPQGVREEIVLATAFSGLADSKPSDRPQARDALKFAGPGTEGVWGQGSPLSGGSATTNAASAEAVNVTADAVAEQVTYWVNQELQNAELTLDGAGHDPIEVSISLQGNEANVAFRSDQAATRELLEGATSHLKEMLAHHGLSLAGVSVGSSGQDAQHQNKDRHPTDSRRATVQVNAQDSTTGGATVRSTGNRVVDLFV